MAKKKPDAEIQEELENLVRFHNAIGEAAKKYGFGVVIVGAALAGTDAKDEQFSTMFQYGHNDIDTVKAVGAFIAEGVAEAGTREDEDIDEY